jgi:glycosyltransferase involved in cell wall biosynthesis
VIEAMNAGRPVVGTDVVGIDEVLTHEHDGLLVPARDPGRLAEALVRLLDDPALMERLAKQGRVTAVERFGRTRMVDETLAAYREAVAGRRSAGLDGEQWPEARS